MSSSSTFKPETLLAKLDVDDGLLDRRLFLTELLKTLSREELEEFVNTLHRSCSSLQTERISFISDKCSEVIEAIQTLNKVEDLFSDTRTNLQQISFELEKLSK